MGKDDDGAARACLPRRGLRRVADSRRPGLSWSPLAAAAALLLLACGPVSPQEALVRYRARIEETLAVEPGRMRAVDAIETRLPRRRARRVEVADLRIGPFEFLGLIGCPLSEVVAARNGPLGRVLEPTRRLAHEVELLAATRECLPSLTGERAARLGSILERKRAQLDAHRWNAVWLDEELERYLGDGPRALVGGRDSEDGPWQLRQAAAALQKPRPDPADVEALERALSELRDDPAVGSVLRALETARVELDRVARRIASQAALPCDRRSKRLVRDFREAYLPLQAKLVEVDRQGGRVLEALSALHHATHASGAAPTAAPSLEVSDAMQTFAREVLDLKSESGLWQGYRAALLRHTQAWAGLLASCGVSASEDSG